MNFIKLRSVRMRSGILRNAQNEKIIRKRLASSTVLGNLGYEHATETPNFFTMTKMVITVGPESDKEDRIEQFVKNGLRVMRMNFSHAYYDEAKGRLDRLRKAEGSHMAGQYLDHNGQTHDVVNTRAALLDTKGPEIRTGNLPSSFQYKFYFVEDAKIDISTGQKVILTTDEQYKDKVEIGAEEQMIYVDYLKLKDTVETGDQVLLNDGAISLDVEQILANGNVECTAQNAGSLGARKGVNLPGKILDLPPLTEKDMKDLSWGVANDVDFVAQSFVRKGSDVIACKEYLQEEVDKLKQSSDAVNLYPPKVIAKIESAEALENFDEILDAADGIMVARGDLGVEIPFRKVTLAQKIMISKCNAAGKPVIVATQMLESMINNPRPTRAEVSDVTNAVYDGCDAVMLSGESAQGKYVVKSVQTMRKIIEEVDNYIAFNEARFDPTALELEGKDRQESVCISAVKAAISSDAKLIIVLVRGGTAARLLAKYRPKQPIMAFCLHEKSARQLNIHRGVYPVVGKGEIIDEEAGSASSPFRNFSHRHKSPKEAIDVAKNIGWVKSGDTVVIVNAQAGDKSYSSSLGVNVVEVR
eukprot:maker-scaffold_11-snap-gene-8.36-mRNA-1 protein AED:0.02 eAED:0.02 QI:69/1/0.8/1/0.75/0.6/5/191/585